MITKTHAQYLINLLCKKSSCRDPSTPQGIYSDDVIRRTHLSRRHRCENLLHPLGSLENRRPERRSPLLARASAAVGRERNIMPTSAASTRARRRSAARTSAGGFPEKKKITQKNRKPWKRLYCAAQTTTTRHVYCFIAPVVPADIVML